MQEVCLMSNTIRVLLVEDSIEDQTLIKEVLSDERIALDLDIVNDGDTAIAFLNKQHPYESAGTPDLILLDLNLPGMDGRQVLTEIKNTPSLRSIPVVILTTSEAEEDIVRSYRLQASCYVVKPIDLEKFIKIIKSINEFWFSAVRYTHNSGDSNCESLRSNYSSSR